MVKTTNQTSKGFAERHLFLYDSDQEPAQSDTLAVFFHSMSVVIIISWMLLKTTFIDIYRMYNPIEITSYN